MKLITTMALLFGAILFTPLQALQASANASQEMNQVQMEMQTSFDEAAQVAVLDFRGYTDSCWDVYFDTYDSVYEDLYDGTNQGYAHAVATFQAQLAYYNCEAARIG